MISSERVPSQVLLRAVFGTAIAGLGFIAVGVASLLVRHAAFSLGVGLMLCLYGALILAIAFAGYKRRSFALGAMVAAALLHSITAISYLSGPRWWIWAICLIVSGVTLAAAATAYVLNARRR